MANNEHLAKLEAELTKDDWQYIAGAVQVRFNQARPKPGEGQPSKDFLEQEKRIIRFLMRKAFT